MTVARTWAAYCRRHRVRAAARERRGARAPLRRRPSARGDARRTQRHRGDAAPLPRWRSEPTSACDATPNRRRFTQARSPPCTKSTTSIRTHRCIPGSVVVAAAIGCCRRKPTCRVRGFSPRSPPATKWRCGCRVAAGHRHYHYFHSTATCGTVGAAAAASIVLGLDERADRARDRHGGDLRQRAVGRHQRRSGDDQAPASGHGRGARRAGPRSSRDSVFMRRVIRSKATRDSSPRWRSPARTRRRSAGRDDLAGDSRRTASGEQLGNPAQHLQALSVLPRLLRAARRAASHARASRAQCERHRARAGRDVAVDRMDGRAAGSARRISGEVQRAVRACARARRARRRTRAAARRACSPIPKCAAGLPLIRVEGNRAFGRRRARVTVSLKDGTRESPINRFATSTTTRCGRASHARARDYLGERGASLEQAVEQCASLSSVARAHPAHSRRDRALTRPGAEDQYSRIAMSKYQVRRISITSYSRARPGGNAW